MERVDFLPLGTVVTLKGSVKKSLIIARGLAAKLGEETKYFDYGGVTYPEGLIGDAIQYFNVDSIDEVVFKGFSDQDDEKMVKNINDWVEKSPFERGDLYAMNQMHAQKATAERQDGRCMDRAQCQAEMNACNSDLASSESKKADLEAKIARLDAAYTIVSTIKSQVESLKQGVSDKDNQEETWKGTEHTWFASFMADYFGASYSNYYTNLDEYHDAIMEEKNKLRNQLNETEGFIGWCKSRLNDLGSWWAQLTN